MRKIVFHCQMSAVGTDSWEFWEVPDDFTCDQIEDLGQELANSNAETFGYSPYPSEDLAEDEEDESYDNDIAATWYDYDPELHDGYRVGRDDSWMEAQYTESELVW